MEKVPKAAEPEDRLVERMLREFLAAILADSKEDKANAS